MSTPSGPLPALTRERLGRLVRQTWSDYWSKHPRAVAIAEAHPGWFTPWEKLSADEKEIDRLIGETLFFEGVAAWSSEVP